MLNASSQLELEGSVIDEQTSLSLTNDPELAVCDANGNVQILFDESGNLKLRGRVYTIDGVYVPE